MTTTASSIACSTEFKTCTHCHQSLPLSEFGWKNKAQGRRRAHCQECNRAKQKSHYERNVSYYVEKAAKNKQPVKRRSRDLVAQSLQGQVCSHCTSPDDLTYYQGPGSTEQPVHMAINAGVSESMVLEAIGRSTVVCKPCLGQFMASNMAFWSRLTVPQRKALQAQRAAEGFEPKPEGFYRRYLPVVAEQVEQG